MSSSLTYERTFWWCTGFTVLALGPALLLPGRPGDSTVSRP
jgi:hypothetical protein